MPTAPKFGFFKQTSSQESYPFLKGISIFLPANQDNLLKEGEAIQKAGGYPVFPSPPLNTHTKNFETFLLSLSKAVPNSALWIDALNIQLSCSQRLIPLCEHYSISHLYLRNENSKLLLQQPSRLKVSTIVEFNQNVKDWSTFASHKDSLYISSYYPSSTTRLLYYCLKTSSWSSFWKRYKTITKTKAISQIFLNSPHLLSPPPEGLIFYGNNKDLKMLLTRTK